LIYSFLKRFYFYNFLMCGGFLASGGDGGALDAPFLTHAAALISACRIEPQVPPTAKRAKNVTRQRRPPLHALSGLCFMNLTFWLKYCSTRPQLPLLMIVFQFVFLSFSDVWRLLGERRRQRRFRCVVACARCRVDFGLPHRTPGAADSQAR
jgi:hypothetical protein